MSDLLVSIFLSVCIANSDKIAALFTSATVYGLYLQQFFSSVYCNVGRSSSVYIDQLCHVC